MKSILVLLLLVVVSPVLRADDHIVDYDRQVDFSAIRTFSFRNTVGSVNRPELQNQVVVDGITANIRSLLISKGLKEVAANADVLVDWEILGQGFAVNEWGRAIATEVRPRERRGYGDPQGGSQDSFIEGVLVLDLTARSSGLLIWRGVYRDNENNAGKLAKNLPSNAKTLLSGFQARKK